ncbi:hypothetical protein PMAYCL1PPCAC_17781, partial [Pristionchus mayeri]
VFIAVMKRRVSITCTEPPPENLSPEDPVSKSPSVSSKRAKLVETPTICTLDDRTLNPMVDHEKRLPLTEGGNAEDLSPVSPSVGRNQTTDSSSVTPSRSSSKKGTPRKGRKKDKKHTVNSATAQGRIEDGHVLNEGGKESKCSGQDVWKEGGSAAGDDNQSTIYTNSTGDTSIEKVGDTSKYDPPLISNYTILKVESKNEEKIRTKTDPVGDDFNSELQKLGLPTNFGPQGKMRTESQNDCRSKSSSSERGAIGMINKYVPMSLPKPNSLNWKGMEKGPREGENNKQGDTSNEKEAASGCCMEESVSRWTKSRPEKVLAVHQEEYIDSHCHLDYIHEKIYFKDMETLRKKYKGAFPPTFRGCIPNFIKPLNWQYSEWIKTIVKDDQVLGTAWGIHPHFSGSITELELQNLRELVLERRDELKIVAIGECGIDLSGKNEVPLDKQLEIFKFQVQLAYEADLPLVIHCREGKMGDPEDEVLNVLKERPNHPIHRHCFTRDVKVAMKWMTTLHDISFGFTPSVLSPENSYRFKQILTVIPLCRVHLETDAPYFKPNDYDIFRELPCSLPGAAITVAVSISEIMGLSLDEVIRHTRGCTQRIYRIGRVRKMASI